METSRHGLQASFDGQLKDFVDQSKTQGVQSEFPGFQPRVLISAVRHFGRDVSRSHLQTLKQATEKGLEEVSQSFGDQVYEAVRSRLLQKRSDLFAQTSSAFRFSGVRFLQGLERRTSRPSPY